MLKPVVLARWSAVAFLILLAMFLAGCASPWSQARDILKFSDLAAERCAKKRPTFNQYRSCLVGEIATRDDLRDGPYAGYAARYRMALAQIDGLVTDGKLTDQDGFAWLAVFGGALREEFIAQARADQAEAKLAAARIALAGQALQRMGQGISQIENQYRRPPPPQSITPFTCTQMGMFLNCR